MARLNSHLTASYLDVAGDDPSKDWFVIRDDSTDQEATLPVTSLPDLITQARDAQTHGHDVHIAGEPFLGNPGQDVTIPAHLTGILEGILVYFDKGATAPTRPPVTVETFDDADDMLQALGMISGLD